jgi:hypothetical protein
MGDPAERYTTGKACLAFWRTSRIHFFGSCIRTGLSAGDRFYVVHIGFDQRAQDVRWADYLRRLNAHFIS